ncbi:Perphorin-2 [Tetrabaena socialis]|uniref:Perphorin-2 n=1 Tax=Tetrabaena socialis TaxID=47790 RepID=A0A2J7ZPW3_9CHLO|nr:Perphorin-2 [Tetrabaena socialis]|eukprot:PNH02308.1 Perphorin-2 [Tetrabaena socialis]
MRSARALLAFLVAGCMAWPAVAQRQRIPAWAETFPPYGCTRDPDQSRFRLDATYTVSGRKVCMTSRVVPCGRPGSPCCDPSIDLAKIELNVNMNCKLAITGVTVNRRPVLTPTWDMYGSGNDKAVYKLTGLGLNLTTADGAVICMTLGGTCPTMQQLCPEANGMCSYAVVQSGVCNCCPVGKLGYYPPPPPTRPQPPSLPRAPGRKNPPPPSPGGKLFQLPGAPTGRV